jgi:DNA-binding PadR family transcriptional regulator
MYGVDPKHSHHRRHRPHRRRRRVAPFAERGWIQFLTLRVLHETPMHGYRLVDEMESRGYVEPGRFETGSIYIILKRMEQKGLLSSEKIETDSGKIRRVYTLTDEGATTLKKGLEFVIKRKQVNDELTEYYAKTFAAPAEMEPSE